MSDEAGTPRPGQGPWSEDLALIFQDEATRTQVDQFLRSKVQPYTTKLEQDISQYRGQLESEEFQQAQRLYNDLQTDPQATYQALTRELAPEQADEVIDYLFNNQQTFEAAQPQEEAQQMEVTPEMQQVIDWAAQQQADQQAAAETAVYEAEKAQFLEANKDVVADIDPFVVQTANEDGTVNWDAAKAAYDQFVGQFQPKEAEGESLDLGLEQPKTDEPAATEEPKTDEPEDTTPDFAKRGTPKYDAKRALQWAIKQGAAAHVASNKAPDTL